MNSDAVTYRTDKTTISSIDGRDCRSTFLGFDNINGNGTISSNSNATGTLDQVVTTTADRGAMDDVTPKKKTRCMKFDPSQIQEPQMGDTKSLGCGSVELNSATQYEQDVRDMHNHLGTFSIIYEQEPTDKVVKKKSIWKRLISPQKVDKIDKASEETSSQENSLEDEDASAEKKSRKWKTLFLSSKQ